MLGKNHLIFGAAAVPYITGAGLAVYENDPVAAAFYALGTIAPDIDSDGGNSLIVQTFSFKVKGVRIAPLAPVSAVIYHLFGHRAVMHYPEVWLFVSWMMFIAGVPLKNCYFFFLGCMMHLVGDGITVGGLPVPPTLRLLVWAIRGIHAMTSKKPLKSIPMLWERKGFPPPNSNGGQVSFQDLTYENRLFLTPKFLRFKVGWPMETIALVILVVLCAILVDPLGNFGTPKTVLTTAAKANDVVYAGFQKSYKFLNFVNENSDDIKGTLSDTLKTASKEAVTTVVNTTKK